MAKNLRTLKALMWVGIILFLIWFLIITFAPSSLLESLDFVEVDGKKHRFKTDFNISHLEDSLTQLMKSTPI